MKKTIFFVLLLLLTVSRCCLADTIVFNADKQLLTVECNGLLAGEPYSIICMKGDRESASLTGENVFFLSQATANQAGCLHFAVIGKMDGTYTFWIGGDMNGESSPRRVGVYQGNVRRLPALLTEIEEEAFVGCSFQILYLENGITAIGDRAFMDCSSLCYIRIPNTVQYIGEDAFSGCPKLVISCEESSMAYQYAVEHDIAVELR